MCRRRKQVLGGATRRSLEGKSDLQMVRERFESSSHFNIKENLTYGFSECAGIKLWNNNPIMTLTDLIQEGEELRDSINDSHLRAGRIQDSNKYNLWVERVVRFLGQTIPEDISIERFMHYSCQLNPSFCHKQSFEGLLNILRAVEELPDKVTNDDLVHRKTDDEKISIHTNVKQEQSQSQHQDIIVEILIEAVKDELTGKQRKELLEIAKNAKDPEKARKSIFDKIKGFGEDVAANIVANIVTNPEVWQGLGALL